MPDSNSYGFDDGGKPLGGNEVRVLVAGGFDVSDPQADDMRAFCRAAGKALAAHGHVLLNGARTELDALIAEAVDEALQGSGQKDLDQRIVSYVVAGQKPVHTHGTLIRSQLLNWEISSANFYIPEQVAQADVVVLIGGFEGTYRAANWAAIAKKPLLPFAAFGGAAAEIYHRELNDFDRNIAIGLSGLSLSSSTASRTGLTMQPTWLLWRRSWQNPGLCWSSCLMLNAQT